MRAYAKNSLWNIVPMLAMLVLSACQGTNPGPAPSISFTNYPPIHLDMSKIDMIEEFKSPMRAPNVEHLLPYSPADAMQIWTKDRLRATGSSKSLQVIIKDASVVAIPLPTQGGLTGLFTDQQDKRYDAKLSVEMRIYGDEAMSEASLSVDTSRSVTIAQSTSPAKRDVIFRQLIHDLMDMTNAELEKNIYQFFGNYINYSQTP